jgi:hypothetical protein
MLATVWRRRPPNISHASANVVDFDAGVLPGHVLWSPTFNDGPRAPNDAGCLPQLAQEIGTVKGQ